MVHTQRDKTCLHCGRGFSWRKKWERSWDEVRFCSQSCRKRGPQDADRIEGLLQLLRAAPRRTLPLDSAAEATLGCSRDQLRSSARLLVHAKKARIYQKGKLVLPDKAKGALELRLL
jgi:hypothetical protein